MLQTNLACASCVNNNTCPDYMQCANNNAHSINDLICHCQEGFTGNLCETGCFFQIKMLNFFFNSFVNIKLQQVAYKHLSFNFLSKGPKLLPFIYRYQQSAKNYVSSATIVCVLKPVTHRTET